MYFTPTLIIFLNFLLRPFIDDYYSSMRYKDYLRTQRWRNTRKKILQRDHYRCRKCKKNNCELHVHHLTYAHRGYEYRHLNDLVTLCEVCHGKEHAGTH